MNISIIFKYLQQSPALRLFWIPHERHKTKLKEVLKIDEN